MGIKGLYSELPRPERKSLVKLTASSFRETGRPLRLAIDFAIWQYQNQAAQGGTNPAIRTLFYRLARLRATPVQAIFVFDGPHKPKLKRNKRSGRGPSVATAQAKKLIRLFGFPFHDAPGEAEAECALLQRHGVVDAVLSEDVDTVMFGCTKSLRNWSSENGKVSSSSTPTHVSVYDAEKNGGNMLDREGMILVALMSGGDYSPDGLPGCGIKVACEAARAGYGKSLCQLKTADESGFQDWREKLSHDLKTNEHRNFQTKHKALKIPSDWPDLEILRYYTHPVVSPLSVVDAIRPKLDTLETVKLEHLREFTREEFGWDFRIGALKFIRVLATALLSMKLQSEGREAEGLVKRIASRREHFSADGEPELRLSYVPSEVVPIDLSQEVEEDIPHTRDALAVNGDNEEISAEVEDTPNSQPKVFDPTKPEMTWIAEEFAIRTVSSAVTAWKEAEFHKAEKKLPKKKRGVGKASSKDIGMTQGALDAHFKVTKPKSFKTAAKSFHTSETIDLENNTPQTPPGSFTQYHTAHATGIRQPSKLPSPTKTKDQSGFSGFDMLGSSPVTPPRTQNAAARAKAIFISSSPPRATSPASSSDESRTRSLGSAKIPDDVCADDPKNTASQIIRVKKQVNVKVVSKTAYNHTRTQTKLKQTSITMFATRLTSLDSSQPVQSQISSSQDPLVQTHRERPDEAQPISFTESEESYIDESSIDLPPLSSLLSRVPASPKSPGKRLKSTAGWEREVSPTRACKSKKTLLVPDATGFVRVVSVDADKRDELEASETRRLAKKGARHKPMRQSDIAIIDLTEE